MSARETSQVPVPVLEQRALDEYRRQCGKVAIVHRLCIESASGQTYPWLSQPARVRVCETPRTKILQWVCKDMLSSVWNVELVEHHPDIPRGARLSMHGTSYTAKGKVFRGDLVATAAPARKARSTATGHAWLRGAYMAIAPLFRTHQNAY
ncbi:hypothetical protein CY652_01335 [Burkholderia sp. WAC0059]|uniref:hypothetical protein n=1 Tax=Burkholderia sp. WAC0059 TaxID=2066022 RepID=UPI000C7F3569|nr:hypothetical protein [Burkholderia sp. WAC0059]PLZ04343.1 hypothetical protein CY652_01335 [Burkholderia sp. WAC0059]